MWVQGQCCASVCVSVPSLVSSGPTCPALTSPEDVRWLQKHDLYETLESIPCIWEKKTWLFRRKKKIYIYYITCCLGWWDTVSQPHPGYGTCCVPGSGSPRRNWWYLSLYTWQLKFLMHSLEAFMVWTFLWSGAVKLNVVKWKKGMKSGKGETKCNIVLGFVCNQTPVCVCCLTLSDVLVKKTVFCRDSVWVMLIGTGVWDLWWTIWFESNKESLWIPAHSTNEACSI